MRNEPVLITGAGSGIGRAVALLCAERGARVAALDLDAARVQQVADEALEAGASGALALVGDVSREADVQDAFDRSAAEWGAPRGVFANAGIEVNAPAREMDLAVWERVLEVNLTGTFLVCKQAVRSMLAAGQSGSIVCASSPAAFVGFAGGPNSAYGASKGGITALVRALAVEHAGYGIRVNAVVPGATDTALLLAGIPESRKDAARAELSTHAREQIPLRRLGRPREIAYAVAWLFSAEAAYVTGSHLVCDGGLLATGPNTF